MTAVDIEDAKTRLFSKRIEEAAAGYAVSADCDAPLPSEVLGQFGPS